MSDDLVERLYDRRVCSLAQNSCRNNLVLDLAANRIEELEAKLAKAMEHVADYSNDPHLVEWANATLEELKGETK